MGRGFDSLCRKKAMAKEIFGYKEDKKPHRWQFIGKLELSPECGTCSMVEKVRAGRATGPSRVYPFSRRQKRALAKKVRRAKGIQNGGAYRKRGYTLWNLA